MVLIFFTLGNQSLFITGGGGVGEFLGIPWFSGEGAEEDQSSLTELRGATIELTANEVGSLQHYRPFLRNCQKPVTNSNALDEREPVTGFAVIPYIQGVTELIKRILNSHNVNVAQKSFQTLGHIFAKPKDPVTKEQ